MISRAETKRLTVELEEEMWAWDPVGIADERTSIPDEYHELAQRAVGRILRGESSRAALEWVEQVLATDWGVRAVAPKALYEMAERFRAEVRSTAR